MMKNLQCRWSLETLLGAVVLVYMAVPASAIVIWHDDFNRDDGNVETVGPLVGIYDTAGETNFKIDNNRAHVFPGNGNALFGVSTQGSGNGTVLHFEWDWTLEQNDNEGIVYAPYAALGKSTNAFQRALSIRVVYVGSLANPPTTGDLLIGDNLEEDIDTDIDIPTDAVSRKWTVDYTVGDPTAILNVAGVAAVTDLSINVAFPDTITGVYFHTANTLVNMKLDNILLDAIDLRADFDSDNDVDGVDFLTWQRNVPISFFAGKEDGDADDDGDVDDEDLAIWEQGYGASLSPLSGLGGVAAVPEPASALLAIFASVMVVGSGRTRRARVF